jgi:ADP-L-glycero-D-manno-heptose 6-epimerase
MIDELVVVTGAAGFIGSNIVSTLVHDGANVVACDRFSHDESWRYLAPFLLHDIVGPESLLPWLKANGDRISAIVHMGAVSATTETDVVKVINNNIRLTLDLWRQAAAHDTTFVYASSAATYGDGSSGFVDDDTSDGLALLRPLNLYGWSKHFVDRRIADDVARGRPTPSRWAGLKFFNVYGPNEAHKGPMRSVVHQLYPAAARGETVRLFKSDVEAYPHGGQMRDFIYVKDCCEIVRNVLHTPTLGGVFNAGTGMARTFDDLARAIFRAAGQEPRIDYIDMPPALRGKYQYFTEADTSKLRAAGLAPQFHSLEDGVSDYVTSYLATEFQTAPQTA